jgi:hypothetical protein
VCVTVKVRQQPNQLMDREKKKGLFSFVAFNEKIRGRSRGQRGKLVVT